MHLLQAEFKEHVSPSVDKRGGQVEDSLHHTLWLLRAQNDACWVHERPYRILRTYK